MFRKVVVLSTLLAVSVQANGYGSYGGMVLGGGGLSGGLGGGLGGGLVLGGLSGGGVAVAGAPGPLAIQTRQQVNYIPHQSSGFVQPTAVAIDAQPAPVALSYRTLSSPIQINHQHIPQPGSFRETQSQDEPHVRVHTVTKPIIQEVREIIAPRRIIAQQVLPVDEQVQTQIARQVQAPAPVAVAPVAVAPVFETAAPIRIGGAGFIGAGLVGARRFA